MSIWLYLGHFSMNRENYKFKFVAGNLALDFVNTVAYRFHPEKRKDHLVASEDVLRWAQQARHSGAYGIDPCAAVTRAALHRIRAVREQIFVIFHAIAGSKAIPSGPLCLIDSALRACQAKRCLLTRHGKVRWDWRPSAGCHDVLLYPILVAAADLLTTGPLNCVRYCADPTCGWLFLDRSNAGKRRWCTMADCGNRDKVRKHYQRKIVSS